MLTLTPRYLVYRRAHIAWTDIVEIKELDTGRGHAVGIVLRSGSPHSAPIGDVTTARLTILPVIRRELARFGAIAVPPAREISIEELRVRVSDYWRRARTG